MADLTNKSIILWHDNLPAQVHWEVTPEGWYVTFASVDHPSLAFPLVAKMRKEWREAGRPAIRFHFSPDNLAMGRLAKVFDSVKIGEGLYESVSLEHRDKEKL